MNELTKEASKQTILEAISFLWLGHRGGVRKSRTQPYRALRGQKYEALLSAYCLHNPLRGDFKDYLTEVDVSSQCERIPEDYQNHLDRKYTQKGGIDIDAFRAWCEELDKDDEWIRKTEKELF